MRPLLRFTMLAMTAAVALLLVPGAARGQDPVKVAPDKYKVLFENDQVRVLEFKAKAGEKVAMHSHPDHFGYFPTAGRVRFTSPDGKTQDAEAKAGQVVWIPAGAHAGENLTDVHVIVTELKKPAKIEVKKPD